MGKMFEPVVFRREPIFWDYNMSTVRDFKGYYHWHQVCEVLFVHEGKGTIVMNREAYEIRRGMLFVFQPYQLHHVYADVSPESPYRRSIMYFDSPFLEEHLTPFPKRASLYRDMFRLRHAAHAYDLAGEADNVERIYAGYQQARSRGAGSETEELLLLFLQLLTCVSGRSPLGRSEGGGDRSLRRSAEYAQAVFRWIEEHYAEEFSLDRLAQAVHLSKFYVTKVFREETGSSVTDYLTARRMKQACRLLETTDLPVEEIGIRVGVPNASYFIRLFKRVVGTTPLKYRKEA